MPERALEPKGIITGLVTGTLLSRTLREQPGTMPPATSDGNRELYRRISDNIGRVMQGQGAVMVPEFPEIIEDEKPVHLLVNDYEKYL